jgi:hypothetical protein
MLGRLQLSLSVRRHPDPHDMRRVAATLVVLALSRAISAEAQAPTPLAGYCARPVNAASRTRPYDDSLAWTRRSALLVGQIVSEAGTPLPQSGVALLTNLRDSVPTRRAYVDVQGVFRLDSLPPGEYVLSIRRLGYQQQWHAVRLLGASADTLCIRLRPAPIDPPPVVPARRARHAA